MYSFVYFLYIWAEVQRLRARSSLSTRIIPIKNGDRHSDTLATGTQTYTVLTRVASILWTACDWLGFTSGTVRWQDLKTTELTGVNSRLIFVQKKSIKKTNRRQLNVS